MSTKSTMILTYDNEHWYKDCNGSYYEGTETEECIVLEIGKKHMVEQDEDGTRIIIEEGTELYKELYDIFFKGPVKIEIL